MVAQSALPLRTLPLFSGGCAFRRNSSAMSVMDMGEDLVASPLERLNSPTVLLPS